LRINCVDKFVRDSHWTWWFHCL